MTKIQRDALESLVAGPRFPGRRLHAKFRVLVRLGLAEMRYRPSDAARYGHDVGFAITDKGRAALARF